MKRKRYKKLSDVGRIESARKWLERNKIFLEVLSIVISPIAAVYVAYKANEISDSQTRIMEQQEMPRIEVRTSRLYNEESKVYDTDMLAVFNMGGKLANFDIKTMEFLQLEVYRPRAAKNDTLMLEIEEYYTTGGVLSGNSEGLIYTVDNNHGDARIVSLRDTLLNKHIGYCDVVSYAQITYNDVFDNKHIDYFKTNPSVVKVSEAEWKKYRGIRGNSDKRYYLRETTTAEVLKLFSK